MRRILIGVCAAALAAVTVACGSTAGDPEPGPTPTAAPAPSTGAPSSSAAPSTTSAPEITSTTPKPPPADPDPLTGTAERSANPVVGVKVDNASFTVPQFGVAKADIVYVQLVEGGLSRLLAVYHTDLQVEVGPVRSVRTTDAELLPVFGRPALAFSGGAPIPKAALADSVVVDASGWEGYFRSDRASAPFNLHVDLTALVDGSTLEPPREIGFTFAATDPRVDAAPAVTTVGVRFPAALTEFTWTGQAWQRIRNGEPVTDYDGSPHQAANVLVQQVTTVADGTVDAAGSPSYLSHTVGSGSVTLYRDGRELTGTWSRASEDAPFEYLDDQGAPLPFAPGRTWVILAPESSSVMAS